jgi:protein LTV1
MEDEGSEDEPLDSDSSDSTPELTSREDFEALMDDFLLNYEVSGGKMKPSLQGSGAEKLQSLRLAMGRDERVTADQQERDDGDIDPMFEENEKRERWDVETVLSKPYLVAKKTNPSSFSKRRTRTSKTIRA